MVGKKDTMQDQVIMQYHALADYQLAWMRGRLALLGKERTQQRLRMQLKEATKHVEYYRKQALEGASSVVLNHYAESILLTIKTTGFRSCEQRALHDAERLRMLLQMHDMNRLIEQSNALSPLYAQRAQLMDEIFGHLKVSTHGQYQVMRHSYKRYIAKPDLLPKRHPAIAKEMSVAEQACSMMLYKHGDCYKELSSTEKQFIIERFDALMRCEDAIEIREAALSMVNEDRSKLAAMSVSGLYGRIEAMVHCLMKVVVKRRPVANDHRPNSLGRQPSKRHRGPQQLNSSS